MKDESFENLSSICVKERDEYNFRNLQGISIKFSTSKEKSSSETPQNLKQRAIKNWNVSVKLKRKKAEAVK